MPPTTPKSSERMGNDTEEAEDMELFQEALFRPLPDLEVLDKFKPTRAISDGQWNTPIQRLTDNFFGKHAEKLLLDINRLTVDHFHVGEGDKRILESVSPWAMDTVIKGDTSLERYVEKIARPDMTYDWPWDQLFSRKEVRPLFVVGLVMRILEDHVFSRLLFGADEGAADLLEEQDRDFLDEDGFSRSHLRSTTVNMLLRPHAGVPPQFWDSVDKLAFTIVAQFLPLIASLHLPGREEPPVLKIYQDVHKIVAQAGFLSVQMRRSDAIVTFDWPTPGERWDTAMENVGTEAFVWSSMLLKSRDKDAMTLRTARVMIAACPEIRRYTPHEQGHGNFRIMPAMVACYPGHRDDHADLSEFGKLQEMKHHPSLVEHAKAVRKEFARSRSLASAQRRSRRFRWQHWVLLIFLLLIAGGLGIWLTESRWDAVHQYVKTSIERAVERGMAASRLRREHNS